MKLLRNPRPTADDLCDICGRPYAHLHEVYFGKNRQISIREGFQVRLCEYHHEDHRAGVHHNKALDDHYKQITQAKYEETHTREEFRKLIGKSYL